MSDNSVGFLPAAAGLDLINKAVEAKQAADAAANAAEAHLQNILRAKLVMGQVIDTTLESRRSKKLANYLRRIDVKRGNARGSRIYRIESAPIVSFAAHNPSMTTWECEATAISELTGKDISGTTNGHHRSTITIKGDLFHNEFPEDVVGDAYVAACNKEIENFLVSVE